MKQVTPRNVNNESTRTSGSGVLCGSAPLVTSYNNIGIMGSCVFYWVRPLAQTRRRSSQTVVPGGGAGGGGQPIVVSRCVSTPSQYEIDASLRGREPGNTEVDASAALGVLSGDSAVKTQQTEKG
jgi:hypothetical protein